MSVSAVPTLEQLTADVRWWRDYWQTRQVSSANGCRTCSHCVLQTTKKDPWNMTERKSGEDREPSEVSSDDTEIMANETSSPELCGLSHFTSQSHATPTSDKPDRQHGDRLSRQSSAKLKAWFEAHKDWPYPSSDEAQKLAIEAGATISQVRNFFMNTRRSLRKRYKVSQDIDGVVHENSWPQSRSLKYQKFIKSKQEPQELQDPVFYE